MARYIGPTCKLARREGTDLYLKSGVRPLDSKCKLDTPPGQHGQRSGRLSDYGLQLREKQKVRRMYGVLEKQFRKYYEEAERRKGDTSENLIELLERRLATVVYRAKFVPTVFAARQFVNHGHVFVNGKRVNVPSYSLRDGDVIEVANAMKENQLIAEGVDAPERDVPEYLQVDHDALKATFLQAPKLADVPYPVQMEPNLVVEFYSR